MNVLSLRIPAAQVDDLQSVLMELAQHGQPRLGIYNRSGWHCSVEMNSTATGVDFKVASDFKHPDPLSAAKQCRERMHEAIAKIKGGRV